MGVWIVPPVAGLIEPAIAPEIHADDIGAIEISKGQVRIYLYQEQMPLEAGGTIPQRIVTGKVFGPIANLPVVIGTLARVLVSRERSPDIQDGPWPRLVT